MSGFRPFSLFAVILRALFSDEKSRFLFLANNFVYRDQLSVRSSLFRDDGIGLSTRNMSL